MLATCFVSKEQDFAYLGQRQFIDATSDVLDGSIQPLLVQQGIDARGPQHISHLCTRQRVIAARKEVEGLAQAL